MNFISSLLPSKDISDLLTNVCSTKSPSLNKLWKCINEGESKKAVLLLRIFGSLQKDRVMKSLEEDSSKKHLYQREFQDLITDSQLILKYSLRNIKSGKRVLYSLPLSEPLYSWKKAGAYLDGVSDFEQAIARLTYFIFSSEMPLEMAKTLNLHTENFLVPPLHTHIQNLNETVHTLYSILKKESDLGTCRSILKDKKKFMTLQQMLLRHAACVDGSEFVSWMDEIGNWISYEHYYGEKFIAQFKLCHLIGISVRGRLMTSAQTVAPPKYLPSKFYDSFQHYLIQKTLHQMTSYLSIHASVYDTLAAIFENCDAERRLVCFYLYLIRELFQETRKEKLLIQFIHLTEEEDLTLFEKAIKVLDRVAENASPQTHSVLLKMACVYYLDYASHLTLSIRERSSVFSWIYDCVNGAELCQFFELSETLLKLIPLSFHKRLLKTFVQSGPLQGNIIACLKDLIHLYTHSFKYILDPLKLERGQGNLNQWIVQSDDPKTYQMLKAFLYFIHFMSYMEFSEEEPILLNYCVNESILEEKKQFKDLQEKQLRCKRFCKDSKFISWIDKIVNWICDQPQYAERMINQFGQCHSIGVSAQKLVLEVAQPAAFIEYQCSKFKFTSSFQNYLIDEALSQLSSYFPPYLPGHVHVCSALATIFKNNDAERRLFCFYLRLIKELFHEMQRSEEPIAMNWTGEAKERTLFERAIKILAIVTENAHPKTRSVLLKYTCVYYLHYATYFKMSPEDRSFVSNWLCDYENHLDDLLQFFNLSEPLLQLIPLRFLIKLAETCVQLAPLQKKILKCLKSLISLYINKLNYIPALLEGQACLKKSVSASLEPTVHQVLSAFLYFIHFMTHLKFSEKEQQILFESLLNSTQEERKLCILLLEEYVKDLKVKLNQDLYEARLQYLKTGFEKIRQAGKSVELMDTLLHHWPEGLRNFDIHLQIILKIEKFCQIKLPLITLMNILLYPVFLSPGIELLDNLIHLRKKIYSRNEIISAFFVPPSLVNQRDECVSGMADPDVFSYRQLSGNYATNVLPRKIMDIANCLQVALLPEPFHIKDLAMNSLTLFSTCSHPLTKEVYKLQNILSSFAPVSNTSLYLQFWSETNGYPEFRLTFIHTKNYLESRHLRCLLEIPLTTLCQEPNLWPLLKTMIKALGTETHKLELEEKLAQQLSELEEFALCLDCFPTFSKAWQEYVSQTELINAEAMDIGLKLLRFIKNVKVNSRMTLARFEGFSQQADCSACLLIDLAAQGNVYCLKNGLSLLPPEFVSDDKEGIFQLKKEEFNIEISRLCKTLREQTSVAIIGLIEELMRIEDQDESIRRSEQIAKWVNKVTIENFCLLCVGKKKYSVTVYFDPLFIARPFKKKQWGLYNEVTFTLNAPTKCTYSIKYKEAIKAPEFETMLHWQLLMLKSTFFEKQLLDLS